MDFSVITDNFGDLMAATGVTAFLTIVILVVATVLAFPLSILRQRKGPWSGILAGFSWVVRSVPAIVLLFFIYFALPSIGFSYPAMVVAVVGLSVQQTGYVMEVMRGGILAIDPRQRDAVKALGIPGFHAWGKILWPQAIRSMIPAYFSNAIHILQATTIAEVITVVELTAETNKLIGLTYQAVPLLIFSGFVYLVLATVLVILQAVAERAFALPGTRTRFRWRTMIPRITNRSMVVTEGEGL